MFKYLILLGFILSVPELQAAEIKVLTWKKLKTHPHDDKSFTQGLVWLEPDVLGESVGQYGESKLLRVRISTGKAESSASLDKRYFGEGLARFGAEFFQLTWREHAVFVWTWNRKDGFVKSKEWKFEDEGWGLTSNSKHLFVSTGSAKILEIDPKTFKTTRTITVKANGKEQDQLNELEWIDGRIFANIWQSSMVLRINPETGAVDGILDFHDLIPKQLSSGPTEAVLNGLAWNPKQKVLYVTGKLWPVLYEIKLDGY